MSMVVQHNMSAMNANRMLSITTGQQSKSTEKLSSGYRINRAADDAAGLSISEKMRKQIKGLDRASSNAQDGVSAVQTAEGALTEVHSMLQRMNELATQAANGTNSEDDRQSIQNEISQLTTEIDRVAETTKFNESYLLKGATDGTKKTAYVNAHDAGIKGTLGESVDGKTSFKLDSALKAGDTITVAGEELTIGDAKSVDDYAKLSEIGNTKVQIGDVYTKADGTEMTVTNKATQQDVTSFIKTAADATPTAPAKVGTLKLADGTTYDITSTTTANQATITKTTVDGKVSTITTSGGGPYADLKSVLGEASDIDLAGATFTSADGKNTYDLVEKLNRDELTTFNVATGTNVVDATSQDTTINSVLGLIINSGASAMSVGDTLTTYTTDVLGNKVETSKTAYRDETAAGYTGNEKIKEGDKIVNDTGATWEFTDKATDSDIGAFLKAKFANGTDQLGTLTLANGDTYKFTQNATADHLDVSKNGAAPTDTTFASSDDTLTKIMAKVDAGANLSGATFTDIDGNVYSVDNLKSGEASMFSGGATGTGTKYAKASDAAAAMGTGASYITAGAKAGLTSFSDLATELNKLAVGAKVNVTSADGKTTTEYTIAGSKDAENGNTLTVDSILGKLKEADAVGWDTDDAGATIDANETYTVVGVDSEEGTTSVKDAYKKIAAALQEASSIGTETGAEVTSNGDGSFEIKQGTVEVAESLNFSLHVGSEADGTNKINVNLDSMDAAGLGVKGLNLVDDTGVKATYAIDAIADAISKVSAQRSALGAVQNRLEHTIANLDNVVENTTSAESAIRDTDMASEMVNFSKNNILAQAGQSMLAQANQSNQGVLSLLG